MVSKHFTTIYEATPYQRALRRLVEVGWGNTDLIRADRRWGKKRPNKCKGCGTLCEHEYCGETRHLLYCKQKPASDVGYHICWVCDHFIQRRKRYSMVCDLCMDRKPDQLDYTNFPQFSPFFKFWDPVCEELRPLVSPAFLEEFELTPVEGQLEMWKLLHGRGLYRPTWCPAEYMPATRSMAKKQLL